MRRRGGRKGGGNITYGMLPLGICRCSWCFKCCNSEFFLQALAGTKWLLAANFRNNAEIMPQFIKQVWLLAALLPANSLLVSIYESGSEDGETGWPFPKCGEECFLIGATECVAEA